MATAFELWQAANTKLGQDGARVPIEVRVVSDKDYAAWLDEAKKKYATDDSRPATNQVAAK